VRDALSPRSLVFLIPGEGADEVRALHARLYEGVLTAKLRSDIPYEPHMTIGAFETHAEAKRAAAAIGPIGIAAQLTAMDLVAYDGRKVRDLHRMLLRRPPQ
jgi:2'-5' RNA ligase